MNPYQSRLGRLRSEDERDKNYPLRLAFTDEPLPTRKFWYIRDKYLVDQIGPSCTGAMGYHFLVASPIRTYNGPHYLDIYDGARRFDEWEGENYEGSSVRGAVRYLQELGHIESYLWASSVQEMKRYVLLGGTLMFGSTWYEDMFFPDSKGFIRPSGASAGGHAYLCLGYSTTKRAFRFINSWGPSWGQKGRFWIHEEDVAFLLDDFGEACAPVEKKIEPIA
jgi:hypothetical protein